MKVGMGFHRKLLGNRAPVVSEEASDALVRVLVDAVNENDTYSGGHSHRVADYSASVARLLGFGDEDVELVTKAATVHDIGKIGIPEHVLRKPGKLTDEELHLIRLHPIFGASVLSRTSNLKRLIPIVLHHHERWDGEGYPSGLSEVDIPIEARIIFVCDAFDAMTVGRPHGEVLSTQEALVELHNGAGTQFDPLLVDAMHEAFRNGLLDSAPGNRSLIDLVN
jgi:putative nucleotidyltransferase with HDIG domain